MRAAIYCRISSDRDGEALGVERQEKACRALAEQMGWEVVAVYVDNDISASTKSKKPRPQYEEMLRLAKAGGIGAILAYSNSRLTRRPAEWITLINLANEGRIRIKTVASGEHDLGTADGRAVALTIAAWDAAEAERTAERVTLKKQEAAEAGKYRGGRRPFGYKKDGVTIHEKEAEVIRYATKAILAGRSLRGIVNELNAKGVLSSTGKEWDPHTLRPVLLRARNAGLLQKGPVWHREPEIVGKAEWPGIISEEEWRAVHRLLTNPARLSPGAGASEPKWLGSGIYICAKPTEGGGECGSIMRTTSVGETPGRPNHKRTFHYKCSDRNHLTVSQTHADAFVLEQVATILRDPRIVRLMTAGEHDGMQGDRDRRTVLTARLDQLQAEWDDDRVATADYNRKKAKINEELVEIEERLAEGVKQAATLPIFNAVDPGAAFLAAPVDVQRAVLRSVVRVEVLPATAPRRVWKNDRIRLSSVVPS